MMTQALAQPVKDIPLRLIGAGLLSIAWLFADWLAAIMPPGVKEQVPTLGLCLALLMFIAGTSGTALLLLGRHILDRVTLPPRSAGESADTPSLSMD